MADGPPRKRVRWAPDAEQLDKALNPALDAPAPRATLLPAPDEDELQRPVAPPVEEGPIKSTHPEFAAALRARNRKEIESLKAGEALDVSLVHDVTAAEEAGADDLEVRFTEGGVRIEPFHLRAERADGFFDAEGSYIAYKGEEDTDAWLETLPDGPIEAPAGRGASGVRQWPVSAPPGDSKPEMTAEDKRAYRQRVVQALLPGETVLDALRRLAGPQERQPSDSGDKAGSKAARLAALRSRLAGTVPERNRAAFSRLTEDAGQLLVGGEPEVYTRVREQLAAGLAAQPAAAASSSDMQASQGAQALAEWLASAVEADEAEPQPQPEQAAEAAAAAPADPETDLFADAAPAADAPVAVALPAAAPEPPGEAGAGEAGPGKAGAGDGGLAEQSGFAFDADSGLWYNSELGCSYDSARQLYRDAASGRWYAYREGGYELVEG